jgi:hypothetical protein
MSDYAVQLALFEEYRDSMEALNKDFRCPESVAENDPRYPEVQAILAKFDGVPPPAPAPPGWKGRVPAEYDGSLESVHDCVKQVLIEQERDDRFLGGGHVGLLSFKQAIGFAYCALRYLGVPDPPSDKEIPADIPAARKQLNGLLAFVHDKLQEGWKRPRQDQPAIALSAVPKEGFDLHNMAIGIDTTKSGMMYYAISPCPASGDKVLEGKAVLLTLPPGQLPKALELFADSKDGKTASIRDLIDAFGHLTRIMDRDVKTHEMPDEDMDEDQMDRDARRAATAEKVRNAQKEAIRTLTSTMADLGRDLRKAISDKGSTLRFVKGEDVEHYRANFTVRHLYRDVSGKLRFDAKNAPMSAKRASE